MKRSLELSTWTNPDLSLQRKLLYHERIEQLVQLNNLINNQPKLFYEYYKQYDALQKLIQHNQQLIQQYNEVDHTNPVDVGTDSSTLCTSNPPELCNHPLKLYCYSIELPYSSGARKYIITTINQFYVYYNNITVDKYYYELIQHNQPCHIYFDIEYKYQYNTQLTAAHADNTIQCFIEYFTEQLQNKYNIELNHNNIIILDSNTDKKYSKHLIIHLNSNHTMFINNVQLGYFISYVCAHLVDDIHNNRSSHQLRHMLVNIDDTGKQQLMIDQSVYSKNRCFRMYLSSKAPQSQPLYNSQPDRLTKLKRDYMCKYKYTAQYDYYLNTLITYIDPCIELNTLQLLTHVVFPESSYTQSDTNVRIVNNGNSYDDSTIISLTQCDSKLNKYQLLHEYMSNVIHNWGDCTSGVIKSILYIDKTDQELRGTICYNVINNRYCLRINRAHKSNGIYLVVSLDKHTYRQYCYDIDCNNNSSIPVLIPNYVFDEDGNDIQWDDV